MAGSCNKQVVRLPRNVPLVRGPPYVSLECNWLSVLGMLITCWQQCLLSLSGIINKQDRLSKGSFWCTAGQSPLFVVHGMVNLLKDQCPPVPDPFPFCTAPFQNPYLAKIIALHGRKDLICIIQCHVVSKV